MTAPLRLDTDLRVGFRPCSYDRRVFSPRIRARIPARYLARAGVRSSLVPVDGSGQFDCVVFQKAYTKQDIELAARWAEQGTKVILDLCDNHFYNPASDPKIDRRIERLERMIDLADAVTVSSAEIGKLIHGKPTFQIDDALERTMFATPAERLGAVQRARRRRGARPIRLVWHGQSGTEHLASGLSPLKRIMPELAELHAVTPLSLTVLGNERDPFVEHLAAAPIPTRFVRWRSSTFAPAFARHDVCVLPIERNEFTVCKTNNRAVAAFLLGLPVIADDIPTYRELEPWIRFGNWRRNIREYTENPEVADSDVRHAQEHIRRTYTEEHVVAQWGRALEAVMR